MIACMREGIADAEPGSSTWSVVSADCSRVWACSARYFTWDAAHFPHPKEMQAGLAAHGRKLVTIVDPHIKKDPDYYIFREAQAGGYLTKTKDGNDYDG